MNEPAPPAAAMNEPAPPAADLDRALAHYRTLAPRYDDATRLIDGVRRRTIDALRLRPGDVVLDAGCGTGFCFGPIEAAIGPSGRLIGIEPSSEMLAIGRHRVEQSGWRNVTLLGCEGAAAVLPAQPDAVLFSYAHDLLQSPAGLEHLFRQVKPGARIAACGSQLFPRWFVPGNWYLRHSHRGYITNFVGFDAPWRTLSAYVDDFTVARQWPGERYIASGRLKPGAARSAPSTVRGTANSDRTAAAGSARMEN